MKPKMYYLVASETSNILEAKVIMTFGLDEYDKAVQAWKECKLPHKEIVETIYG